MPGPAGRRIPVANPGLPERHLTFQNHTTGGSIHAHKQSERPMGGNAEKR